MFHNGAYLPSSPSSGMPIPYLCVTRRLMEALGTDLIASGDGEGWITLGEQAIPVNAHKPCSDALDPELRDEMHRPGGVAMAGGPPHPERLVPYEALMRRPAEALKAESMRRPMGRLRGRPDAMRIGHGRDDCRMPTGILDLCRALRRSACLRRAARHGRTAGCARAKPPLPRVRPASSPPCPCHPSRV